jgi:hypothetical protein
VKKNLRCAHGSLHSRLPAAPPAPGTPPSILASPQLPGHNSLRYRCTAAAGTHLPPFPLHRCRRDTPPHPRCAASRRSLFQCHPSLGAAASSLSFGRGRRPLPFAGLPISVVVGRVSARLAADRGLLEHPLLASTPRPPACSSCPAEVFKPHFYL